MSDAADRRIAELEKEVEHLRPVFDASMALFIALVNERPIDEAMTRLNEATVAARDALIGRPGVH